MHRSHDDPKNWYSNQIYLSVRSLLANSSPEDVERVLSDAHTVITQKYPNSTKKVDLIECGLTTAVATGVLCHTWFLEALGRSLERIAAGTLRKSPWRSDILTPPEPGRPIYALRQKGRPDTDFISDYRNFQTRASVGRLPNYPWLGIQSDYSFPRFDNHMTDMVISLMELGLELFAQGNVAAMPTDLQRFGPLMEREEVSRAKFANDPRLHFTSGLSEYNFGAEQRMRGPAASFSQIAMHYTELVIDKILDGTISGNSVADVQRSALDPTALEIAGGYKEALVEAALKMPRSIGFKFQRSGKLKGVSQAVGTYTEDELKHHGLQPSCPFGNAGGSRLRVNHLTAINPEVMSGCSGFDDQTPATLRGKWHLGLFNVFLRSTGMLAKESPDLKTISSILALQGFEVLDVLPHHMMKTRKRVRGELDGNTLGDDPHVREALREYIRTTPFVPLSVTKADRTYIGNTL